MTFPVRVRRSTRKPRTSWRAESYRHTDLLVSDLLLACPTCCDLHPNGTANCDSCGAWLGVSR